MTQDNETAEPECYVINALAKSAGIPATVEAFLISRLGTTAGARFYKELLTVAKDAAKQADGFPAILLDVPGGEFATLIKG
jgi:hypothetical protein